MNRSIWKGNLFFSVTHIKRWQLRCRLKHIEKCRKKSFHVGGRTTQYFDAKNITVGFWFFYLCSKFIFGQFICLSFLYMCAILIVKDLKTIKDFIFLLLSLTLLLLLFHRSMRYSSLLCMTLCFHLLLLCMECLLPPCADFSYASFHWWESHFLSSQLLVMSNV